MSAEVVVFEANNRCNQQNLLAQLKSGSRSLSAPVDNLLSNGAYMVQTRFNHAYATLVTKVKNNYQQAELKE